MHLPFHIVFFLNTEKLADSHSRIKDEKVELVMSSSETLFLEGKH